MENQDTQTNIRKLSTRSNESDFFALLHDLPESIRRTSNCSCCEGKFNEELATEHKVLTNLKCKIQNEVPINLPTEIKRYSRQDLLNLSGKTELQLTKTGETNKDIFVTSSEESRNKNSRMNRNIFLASIGGDRRHDCSPLKSELLQFPSLVNQTYEIEEQDNEIDFKKIEEWIVKDEGQLMVEIFSQKASFERYLKKKLEGDAIVLIINILAKLNFSSITENKAVLINMVANEKFIGNIEIFLMKIPLQTMEDKVLNSYFWNNMEQLFNNLLDMIESIIVTIPTRACEVLPKLLKSLCLCLPNLEREHNVNLSSEIKNKMTRLQERLQLSSIELERKVSVAKASRNIIEEEPPDNFRNLSVYPSSEEITDPKRAFVRKNIIQGKYESVQHYLDVQFRILKEDFVAPLREGVCSYLEQARSETTSKISNLRIHTNVMFLSTHCQQDQVGAIVKFPKTKNLDFTNSKRFIFGSLLCFTKDNFKTFLFGRVIDSALLNQGKVGVGFDHQYNNYILNTPYIMIECNVFFEPYYHVLKALQNMPEDMFPMKDYLIDVDSQVTLPAYLNKFSSYRITNWKPNDSETWSSDEENEWSDRQDRFDDMFSVYDNSIDTDPKATLAAYLNKLRSYHVDESGPKTTLMDEKTWPSAQEIELDDTQYLAYKAALTQKFAVIQGPPGTGKTYTALRIVETLLRNSSHWYNNTPILIICLTNHALDQFLEGLIHVTKRILRIGGQSKNEKLQLFNLDKRRRALINFHNLRLRLYNSNRKRRQRQENRHPLILRKRMLSDIMDDIKRLTLKLEETERFTTIIDFDNFYKVDDEIRNSWFYKASAKDILKWLLDDHQMELNGKEDYLKDESIKLDSNNGVQEENTTYNENEIDVLDDLFNDDHSRYNCSRITSLLRLHMKLIEISDNDKHDHNSDRKVYQLEKHLDYLQMRLRQGKNTEVPQRPEYVDYLFPQNMYPNDRWQLYFYWLHLYKKYVSEKLLQHQHNYREAYEDYIKMRNIYDIKIMKEMLIVAMTTTGAARLQTTLQALKCKIVVVEEAAEVLESHITVSLTSDCNHLILIGDHQQLRPSTANYRMEKDFNLGISMFERMILNNIQCHRLGVQHRMRPEIAKLICPNIYPKLQNHISVYDFSPILGIDPCLYFIDHQHKEIENDSSKANIHEAKFLIRLARYLILNGYQREDITILAAYSGQMFALFKEREHCNVNVRVTTLDNYQGEECKIILLSLVRNNDDGKIGFLKIENRVCVALSRAKEGLYIMGNMDLLSQNSEIWPKIKCTLEKQNAIGKFLTIRCQMHPEEVINASSATDFDQAPEGGCTKICGALLNCQHFCPRVCHILNREHVGFKCTAPCQRKLCDQHDCPKICYEDCGECMVLLKHTFECGHELTIECHKYVEYTENCSTLVEHTKATACGHTFKIPCHLLQKEMASNSHELLQHCTDPCSSTLQCSHACSGTCGRCYQGRIHEICPCRRRCKHVRCTAACELPCTVPPCSEPCEKMLGCGHPCIGFCGDPCPPLCRICDKEELRCWLLGGEYKSDARFVLLDECKHVIESENMDNFCKYELEDPTSRSEIKCPKCGTTLTSTQRYSDYIKQKHRDVVKLNQIEVLNKTTMLVSKIKNCIAKVAEVASDVHDCQKINLFLNKSQTGLENDSIFSLKVIPTVQTKIEMVDNVVNIFKFRTPSNATLWSNIIEYVYMLTDRFLPELQQMTNQEISDFDRELLRLQRMKQYTLILNHSNFINHSKMADVVALCSDIETLLFKLTEYDYDDKINEKIDLLNKLIESSTLSEEE